MVRIEAGKRGKINILTISGKITHGEGDEAIRNKFDELLGRGERLFIFDMTKVPYSDTSGIMAAIGCHKRVREQDGVIKLVMEPKGKTWEIFALTSLHKVFEIYGDLEEALASFAK